MNKKLLIIFVLLVIIVLVSGCIPKEPEEKKISKSRQKASNSFKDITVTQQEILKDEEDMSEFEIVTIYDNYLFNPELKTGWGFSCLVRGGLKCEGGFNILFDTGADSSTLLFNMERLEILPEDINTVILSHIHGDHIGGLNGFLEKNKKAKIYFPASFPFSFKNELRNNKLEIIEIKEPIEIFKNIWSTGEMQGPPKEQSLVINVEKGLVIITGCAHPGIVDIIKKAKELLGKKIYLVLGGFHLFSSSDNELEGIVKDFRDLGVEKVAPCHCSGDRARELFKKEYKENFMENGVGRIINI